MFIISGIVDRMMCKIALYGNALSTHMLFVAQLTDEFCRKIFVQVSAVASQVTLVLLLFDEIKLCDIEIAYEILLLSAI